MTDSNIILCNFYHSRNENFTVHWTGRNPDVEFIHPVLGLFTRL